MVAVVVVGVVVVVVCFFFAVFVVVVFFSIKYAFRAARLWPRGPQDRASVAANLRCSFVSVPRT